MAKLMTSRMPAAGGISLSILLTAILSAYALSGCGGRRDDALSTFASSTDPDERSENSRDDRPEFQMTKELPDVSRRLTNWINTCWLHAGVKELEFAHYRRFGEGRPLSVEFTLMNSLHDRLMRITHGGGTRIHELEAGGEMNEVRRLARTYGLLPEATWSQKSQPWGKFAKELNPKAANLREKMLRRRARGESGDDVIAEAERLFTDFIAEKNIHVPERFNHSGRLTTPVSYADAVAPESPDEFILLVARPQFSKTPTKQDLETNQDGFVTSWANIGQTIVDMIDHDQSVLTAIYWHESATRFDRGVLTIDDEALRKTPAPEGHVVNIVGYHLNDEGQLDRLKIENTWGRYEGSSGFYSVTWSDLKKIFMTITIPDGFEYVKDQGFDGVRLKDGTHP